MQGCDYMNNKDLRGFIVENSRKHIDYIIKNNLKRIFKLNNEDIIEVKGVSLQFKDNLLYEVEFGGLDDFMQTIWSRTGVVFTIDEVNKL
jgi:hypothetical protein